MESLNLSQAEKLAEALQSTYIKMGNSVGNPALREVIANQCQRIHGEPRYEERIISTVITAMMSTLDKAMTTLLSKLYLEKYPTVLESSFIDAFKDTELGTHFFEHAGLEDEETDSTPDDYNIYATDAAVDLLKKLGLGKYL